MLIIQAKAYDSRAYYSHLEGDSAHPCTIEVKTLFWLLLRGKLLVRDCLVRFQLITSHENMCPLCRFHKNILLTFFCRYINSLWFGIANLLYMNTICIQSMPKFFKYLFHSDRSLHRVLALHFSFFAFVWTIWNMSNRVIFSSRKFWFSWMPWMVQILLFLVV